MDRAPEAWRHLWRCPSYENRAFAVLLKAAGTGFLKRAAPGVPINADRRGLCPRGFRSNREQMNTSGSLSSVVTTSTKHGGECWSGFVDWRSGNTPGEVTLKPGNGSMCRRVTSPPAAWGGLGWAELAVGARSSALGSFCIFLAGDHAAFFSSTASALLWCSLPAMQPRALG